MIILIFKYGHYGTERLSNLSKATQLKSGGVGI